MHPLAATMALIILSMALAWWLDQVLNTAVAFAIVGALWLLVAAVEEIKTSVAEAGTAVKTAATSSNGADS